MTVRTVGLSKAYGTRLALSDVVNSGFEALRNEPSEHLKVLAFPGNH